MRKNLKFYFEYLTKQEKISYISLLAGRSLSGILDVAGVLCIGYLGTSIGTFVANGNNEGQVLSFANLQLPAVTAKSLPMLMLVIASIFITKSLLAILLTKIMATKVAEIEARAARQISQNALGGSIETMRLVGKDTLVFSVQSGTSAAFTGLMNSFANLISEGFLFILLSIAFITVNPIATIGMLSYFTLLAIAIHLFVSKKLHNASASASKKIIEANVALGDVIGAFREVAVAGQRNFYFNRIFAARRNASRSIGEQTYLAGMPRHIIETGLILGIGIFIASQSLGNDIAESASTIGIFLAGGFRIVAAMLPWQNALVNIRICVPQAVTAWKLLENMESPVLPNPGDSTELSSSVETKPIRVELRNVSYTYPGNINESLKQLSLVIEPGQQVAFIGSSGSGKSTLADLILGLAEPTSGSVLLDGVPAVSKINQKETGMGYVPQSPGMLTGSLAENIAIAKEPQNVDAKKLNYAIDGSHLERVIENLPNGLESDIGLHHDSFSGGQRQRIALARALYNRPGLIVLDEATSALDAESENEIVSLVRSLKGKITVVTIAHRLNAIQEADIVHLVENGRIVASGSLNELRATNADVANAIRLLTID